MNLIVIDANVWIRFARIKELHLLPNPISFISISSAQNKDGQGLQ